MIIKTLAPNKCTNKELDLFLSMVLKGKQVDKNGLKPRILNSVLLGFCYIENTLVSVSSIKSPNEGYKKRIFEKADISELAKEHLYELGYAYTKKKYRGQGLNFKINEKLLESLSFEAVYATTHNVKMKSSLLKMGFEVIGSTYRGDRGDDIQILSYEIARNLNDDLLGFNDLKDSPSSFD